MKYDLKPVLSGFKNLDKVIGGFYPSELTVIASRPSMGKTGLLLSVINNISINDSIPAVFFSIEMAEEVIMQRMASIRYKISMNKIRIGKLDEEEKIGLEKAFKEIEQSPLIINDSPFLLIDDLCSNAKKTVENGAKIIFIDYLGLIQTENKDAPIYEQISIVVQKLKILARELKVPVIVTCQMGKSYESPVPELDHLRGSGSIEQVADVIVFVHRTKNPDENPKLIVAKNRNGATDTIEVGYIADCCCFGEAN